MLDKLLSSPKEASLVAFFVAAPLRAFSPVEVSRRLRLPYLKTIYALGTLVEAGILTDFSKKGKRLFLLNTKNRLLPELKSEFLKFGPKYQDELLLAIKKLGEIKAAFLSGVFMGYANLPVDLLLVGKVNLRKLDEFLKAAEKMMGQEVNFSIMTEGEFLQRRDTYDRFIRDIFDYRHLVVCDSLTKKLR